MQRASDALFASVGVVALLCAVELNNIISAAAAGASLSAIVYYEQRKLNEINQ